MKNNKKKNIDTQYVYVKNEQVYALKRSNRNTFIEVPVRIDWIPALK